MAPMAPIAATPIRAFLDTAIEGFLSDGGWVRAPMAMAEGYRIMPYSLAADVTQRAATEALSAEWGVAYTDAEVRLRWGGTDVMFLAAAGPEFIGCVAVDRTNFYPFVSHLYVAPALRGAGFGDRLLQVAEEHAVRLGFQEARLWCSDALLPYYNRRGWQAAGEPAEGGQTVLKKGGLRKR